MDRNNPYLTSYKIPGFPLFSGDKIQSTLEHIGRLTIQCGELVNYDNFDMFKLRLFPNSLTTISFFGYTCNTPHPSTV